jgi:chaperonin GroES
MEIANGSAGGVTGIEKFGPKSVVQVDLKDRLNEEMPQAREVLRNVRGFVPLRDQVMVRRLAEDEMTDLDTLYIPDEAKDKPMVGVVMAVGRGKFDAAGVFHPCEVEPNDVVSFGRYAGTEYKVNGKTVLVMKESEIAGVWR